MGNVRRQYSASVNTCAAKAVAFGFPAVHVALSLQSCGVIFVNFSTAVGTTGGFRLTSGTVTSPYIVNDGWPMMGFGLTATTTGPIVDVLALSA